MNTAIMSWVEKKNCLKSMDIVVAAIPNHPCVFKKNTKEMPPQMNLLGMFFENFIMEQHLLF
jgi:hypothetical protein